MMDRGKRQNMLARRTRNRVVALLGCMVVIATAVALMVPALSMTRGDLVCGMEEHKHTEDCYETVLTCTLEEDQNHTHTDACYTRKLVCDQPEHVHVDSCYAKASKESSDGGAGVATQGAAEGDAADEGQEAAGDAAPAASEGKQAVQDAAVSKAGTLTANAVKTSAADAAGSDAIDDEGTDGSADESGDVSANGKSDASAVAGATGGANASASGEAAGADDASSAAASEDAAEAGDNGDAGGKGGAGGSADAASITGAASSDESAAADAVDEQPMPAQEFKAHLKDADGAIVLTVAVEAPVGALPADAFMKIDGVPAEDVSACVRGAFDEALGDTASEELGVEEAVSAATVVDVSFFDGDDELIAPAKKVTVKITGPVVRAAQNVALAHVVEVDDIAKSRAGGATRADGTPFDRPEDAYKKAEFVKKVTLTSEHAGAGAGADAGAGAGAGAGAQDAPDTLKFKADSFSPYAVVVLDVAAAEALRAAVDDVVVSVAAAEGEGAEAGEGAAGDGDDEAGEGDDGDDESGSSDGDDGAGDVDDGDDESSEGDDGHKLIESAMRPAQSFQQDVAGEDGSVALSVSVEAPEGALPEGTTMVATLVDDSDVLDAAKEQAAGEGALGEDVVVDACAGEGAESASEEPEDAGAADVADAQVGGYPSVRAVAADITFLDAEGNKVEPLVDVRVTMASPLVAEVPADALAVVHVADDLSAQVVEGAEVGQEGDAEAVAFDAAEFSVYAIVYTVDFHYEVDGQTYEFSIPGGGFISLRELVRIVGVAQAAGTTPEQFVADVESVEFSDPDLVSVSKVEEDDTVGGLKDTLGLECEYSAELTEEQIAEIDAQAIDAGDWALISLQPFTSEESLTVTMANGDVWTVRVTDEAVSSIQSGKSYILYTVSNYGNGDIYRVLDIYGHSHDYTDLEQLEALGEEYLWTVSYSSNWIIRSKSTVRGSDNRDYYVYLDVNSGHNQQVNSVVKQLLPSATNYPYVSLHNNNTTFNIYGINNNGLSLCWNNGFLIHNADYAASMRFYQQHPTYDYTVITENSSEGLISGYSSENGRQENNTDRIQSTTTNNKTNGTLITATPTSSKFLFSHWELNGKIVYANGTTEDDGTGVTMGARIEPDQLTFTGNNQELKAHFIRNPDVSSDVPAKSFDEQALQAWYDLLQNTNPPLASVEKTAEVYDYYNRIYQIDFTAASGVQTFASDIDLSFIMDVSNSMLFPATLSPYKSGGNTVKKKLTTSSLSSLPHDNGEKYFVVGDEGYTSTVYILWYKDGWHFSDASQYAVNRYADRNGGPNIEKEWGIDDVNDRSSNRLNSADDFIIYTASEDYFTGFGDIYSKETPAHNRLYYMKNAMETIVSDAKDLAEEAARIGYSNNNSNVRVAWEVFNRLHSNGEDFKSVTDPVNGEANFNAIVRALDDTESSGGTRQDRGLEWAKNNFNYASAATTSTKRIAILITDGAPMLTGGDTTGLNYTYTSYYESALGNYYAPTSGDGAWLRDQIRNKANSLKAGADGRLNTDDDVTLITIGLGVDRVANAPEWLEDVASTLPSDLQVSGGATKYFYNVTDTTKLKYVLYDILQTFSAGAVVDTTVTDVIDDAFYPVDKLGKPLGVGDTYTDDNGVRGVIGQKQVTLNDGSKKTLWTVTWDHETVRWADHGGWHGSVLVKAKEDFLGGNTINTNQESSVTANSFTADNSYDNFGPKVVPITTNKTFNPPTPYVNVNELKMESSSTRWTVYLGEDVNPADELIRLCEQVRVVEMVTQTRDDDGDGESDHRYNNGIMLGHQTEGEAEKFLLKDVIGNLTNDDVDELLDGDTVIKEYDKSVAQAYGHDAGTIYLELIESEVANGETGLETSPHRTTVTNADNGGETVEQYVLKVWYMPNNPDSQVTNYHTGNYIGEGAGKETNDVTTEFSHEINVFAKSMQVFKRNEDYSKELTSAKFAIYRTWRQSDGVDKKTQITGKSGDYIVEYPEVPVNANGVVEFEKLPKLGENEKRYLVETEAPNGYIKLADPLEVTLNISSSYRPVPPKADNGWSRDEVADRPYDWEEIASLTLNRGMAQKANSAGEKDETATPLDSQDGRSYYLVANNPGVELPNTGGPGTAPAYFIGALLMGLAAMGLVMRRKREAA